MTITVLNAGFGTRALSMQRPSWKNSSARKVTLLYFLRLTSFRQTGKIRSFFPV
jgi:hypothetical protein